MKRPNLHTAIISEVLEFAANANGVTKRKADQAFAATVLSQVAWLDRIKCMPWSSRHWADKAYVQFQAMGVTDGLELCRPFRGLLNVTTAQFRKFIRAMGLYMHTVNGGIVITRKPCTPTVPESRSLADMTPAERGNSSPKLL